MNLTSQCENMYDIINLYQNTRHSPIKREKVVCKTKMRRKYDRRKAGKRAIRR